MSSLSDLFQRANKAYADWRGTGCYPAACSLLAGAVFAGAVSPPPPAAQIFLPELPYR